MKQYLEAGKIINKRGIKGELKVETYCDTPQALCALKKLYLDPAGKDGRAVLSAKVYKGCGYLLLEGVSTPEQADALRGRVLYADRGDLPLTEGSVFIDDLIGLPVYDTDTGTVYGKVKEVFNRGASDIYAISDGKNEYFVPAVKEFIIAVDTEKGIAVRPIAGMFDQAEEIR